MTPAGPQEPSQAIDGHSERSRDRALRFDHERRQALHDLIALLTDMVAETQLLTSATLRSDRESLADVTASFTHIATSPVLDLALMTEIYGALRRAVVDSQLGRPSPAVPSGPSGGLSTGDDRGELPPALTDAEAALSRMLAPGARLPTPAKAAPALAGLVPSPLGPFELRWPSHRIR